MTTFIDLLRHGETENSHRYCGSTDYPLTPRGWAQMWHTVEMSPFQWQQIITSPLIRCADFAQALGQRYCIPVTQDARLQEIHFGAWENQSAAELMQVHADAVSSFWQNPLIYPPPKAEHLLDFETRVLSAWYEIQRQFVDKRILLITHSGVIRVIICHIQQYPVERLLEFEVKHASMQHVCIEQAGHSQVRLVSDSSYDHQAISRCDAILDPFTCAADGSAK
ncbi:alpha-ribazole phosphatase [Nitrosomonas sp. Nm166]|nr:alpha-ribazole phosphatase [Nitrosomonas sp. Nm166]